MDPTTINSSNMGNATTIGSYHQSTDTEILHQHINDNETATLGFLKQYRDAAYSSLNDYVLSVKNRFSDTTQYILYGITAFGVIGGVQDYKLGRCFALNKVRLPIHMTALVIYASARYLENNYILNDSDKELIDASKIGAYLHSLGYSAGYFTTGFVNSIHQWFRDDHEHQE